MVASCRRVRPDSTGAPVVRDLLVDIVLMKIDLEALTIPQLAALIEQAHDLIDSKQKEAVTSARAEIQKIASDGGYEC
jgi:hypothetical protein